MSILPLTPAQLRVVVNPADEVKRPQILLVRSQIYRRLTAEVEKRMSRELRRI